MYVLSLGQDLDYTALVKNIAERVTEDLKVVILSSNPEEGIEEFRLAWKLECAKMIADRDLENDLVYMTTLTDLLTCAQQISIGMSDDPHSHQIKFSHPYGIEGGMWEDCQIMVCCDELSFMACNMLFRTVRSNPRLMLTFGVERPTKSLKAHQNIESIELAREVLDDLLKEQLALCSSLGLKLSKLVHDDGTLDAGMLGTAIVGLRQPNVFDDFYKRHNELISLRFVLGRLHNIDSKEDKELHGLKVLSRYVVDKQGGYMTQLLDDPYGYEWAKVIADKSRKLVKTI